MLLELNRTVSARLRTELPGRRDVHCFPGFSIFAELQSAGNLFQVLLDSSPFLRVLAAPMAFWGLRRRCLPIVFLAPVAAPDFTGGISVLLTWVGFGETLSTQPVVAGAIPVMAESSALLLCRGPRSGGDIPREFLSDVVLAQIRLDEDPFDLLPFRIQLVLLRGRGRERTDHTLQRRASDNGRLADGFAPAETSALLKRST